MSNPVGMTKEASCVGHEAIINKIEELDRIEKKLEMLILKISGIDTPVEQPVAIEANGVVSLQELLIRGSDIIAKKTDTIIIRIEELEALLYF